jgi:sugar (pentulose or hexulose) kinase
MNKLENFINNNNFTELSHITNKLQQITRNCINNCKHIIKPNDKWKCINMNPSAPHICGTIKLHKQGKPIRPIVNWIDNPAYKLAQDLSTILTDILQLPNAFNVQNTSTLAHSLKFIKTNNDIQMCSLTLRRCILIFP